MKKRKSRNNICHDPKCDTQYMASGDESVDLTAYECENQEAHEMD